MAPRATSSTVSERVSALPCPTDWLSDLPAPLVHTLLQRAKKAGKRDYALVYLLFATGLSPSEIVHLKRSQHLNYPDQILQVQRQTWHQLPLNHWILGKRYGSTSSNPLTQWLNSRRDEHMPLFIDERGHPLLEAAIQETWQRLTADLRTPEGQAPMIDQAQQTWCVEMLLRGLSTADLALLTGWDGERLHHAARMAGAREVLERALRSDQKTSLS